RPDIDGSHIDALCPNALSPAHIVGTPLLLAQKPLRDTRRKIIAGPEYSLLMMACKHNLSVSLSH
ncbi:hypothetical protein, partial [Pectobacterium odoriferum]